MKSAPAIAFDYRPSAAIAALVTALVGAAALAPWVSALPLFAKIALSLPVLACGVVAIRRFVRARFRRIAYRASGWVLVDAAGAEHAALLASHARYGAWIALDFRLDGRDRFRALVGPDNADAETRRRLIVLLSRAEVVQTG
jgi:hypothetical protein